MARASFLRWLWSGCKSRSLNRPVRQRVRPQTESLEDRLTPAVLYVDALTDVGTGVNPSPGLYYGDLRYCINQANADGQANEIVFEGGPGKITLTEGPLVLSNTAGVQSIVNPSVGLVSVSISGNNSSGVFQIDHGVTANIAGVTITGGNSGGDGGGIANSGTLTLSYDTVSDNFANGLGGGVYNQGILIATGCSVTGNTSAEGGGIGTNGGNATLMDDTISGNSSGDGGGIENEGTLTVTNCTISANSAAAYGGGVNCDVSVTLRNTIVAGNSALYGPDVNGPAIANYSLIENTSDFMPNLGSGNNLTGINPELGPLAKNGGPTEAMALLANSPAINAGDPDVAGLPAHDQRGPDFPRVVGGFVDMGAVESAYLVGPVWNVQPSSTLNQSQSAVVGHDYASTFSVKVTDLAGQPLAGVQVRFTAPGSDSATETVPGGTFTGNVAGVVVTTNAEGIATAPTFTANNVPGSFLVSASVNGTVEHVSNLPVPPSVISFNFSLSNTEAVTAVSVLSGSGQKTRVDTAMANPLQVLVTGPNKQPVAGVMVDFQIPATGPGATASGTVVVATNAQGIATLPALTSNTKAGQFTVVAKVAGIATPAQFSFTNLPGSAASVVVVKGSGQSAGHAGSFLVPLEVVVKDAYGNVIAGESVTFTVVSNHNGAGGNFSGKTMVTVVTNAQGLALAPQLRTNATSGSFTVTATVSGVDQDAVFDCTIV